MRFDPLSAQELASQNLIPEGYYRYKVSTSQDTQSKKGDDQIKLNVEVYVNGKNRYVFDYLTQAFLMKIYQFCEVNDLMEKYHHGTLVAQDCFDRSKGYVNIVTQKDKTGIYGDKSVIKSYILDMPDNKDQGSLSEPKLDEPFDNNEDLPF